MSTLKAGWLDEELASASRDFEAWSPGLKESFESHFEDEPASVRAAPTPQERERERGPE